MNLQWINSAGGPLVCASPATGRIWRGVHGSSVKSLETDYERACGQMDYVGIIPCGPSQVLILGDEPLQSAFAGTDEGVIIVRWVSCTSNEHATEAIAQLPVKLPTIEEPKTFYLNDSGLLMFDAALSSIDTAITKTEINPGIFKVTAEIYKKAGVYEFLVHRLLRD